MQRRRLSDLNFIKIGFGKSFATPNSAKPHSKDQSEQSHSDHYFEGI